MSLSDSDERVRERERWMEFERRDGWYSGFICGVLTGAMACAIDLLIWAVAG